MDALLALKPIFTALVLPAAALPLLIMVCVVWAWQRAPSSRVPLACVATLVGALWGLSCQGMANWLAQHALPQVQAVSPAQLQAQQVQAIVVLGGGVEADAAEYQGPALPPESLARLIYAVHLAHSTGLPLAYSGGVGWGGSADQTPEAEVAAQTLARLHAPALRWMDNASRDTHENALRTAELLKAEGIQRIALVTHAWHMPRSVRQFEAVGFEVVPAPMGFVRSDQRPLLQWLPSGRGLRDSSWILREWLGLRLT
jgi:uncharacterized SAM-binding protein YcdF (DUF218 family)